MNLFFRPPPSAQYPIVWSRRDPAFAQIAPLEIIHVELTTSSETVGGAIAAINSVHLNTRHAVRFHIFAPDDGDLIQHLSNWITTSHLKEIDYEVCINVDDRLGQQQLRLEVYNPICIM